MRHAEALEGSLLISVLLVTAVLIAFPETGCAQCADCPEPGGTGEPVDPASARYIRPEGVDLVCYPATLQAPEGKWTFFLRGPDAITVERARLVVGDAEYPVKRLATPTPTSALLDFEYPPLKVGEAARLVLTGGGREIAQIPVRVTSGARIPPERRQRHLVRVQLRQWTLLYPLHGFRSSQNVKDRELAEIAGDEEFRRILLDLGIEKIRKVMSRYAEDDSIHWDARIEREIVYRGTQLRQYIMCLDPDRSEAAFREIFLGFDQVEGAFINEDRSRSRK